MKLEYNVFPNFYKKYDWVMEREEDKLFTGRKYYLENFWRNLSNVANNEYSRQNKAFIGQRKMGKTAFLVRCYNLAFWEQDEVVPFYYCFPQTEKLNLREITEEIAFKFLQQAISFVTKNREYSEINSVNLIFHKLRKSNFAWFEDFHFYWEECQEDIKTSSGRKLLEKVWNLTKSFSGLFGKKCLLIIDEYQKTVCNLIDEEGHSVVCHESIGKIINDRNIYTIISGSQISMIAYDVLTPELYNRIPGEKFAPLMEEEAHQLIREYAGKKSYKGIEKDVYELTGGNPYYIKILFTPTNKFYEYLKRDKKWKNKKDIEELYNFEMLHPEGEVFQFWRNHINDKLHLLNDDPPKHKGATLRLLKYIAERDGYVHIVELQEKFPEIKDMRARLRKLRDTDLILDTVDSEQILNFSDHVLPVVMTKMYQKIFLGSLSAEAFNKYKEEWFKTLAERISKRFDGIDGHIDEIKEEIEESAQKHETTEERCY